MQTKILYVEDELNLGKIVKESLENKKYEIRWETDGNQVMSHFSNFQPDICILDIMLPNLDGYSICKSIREKYPAIPIIFLTAKTETEDLLKGFESGGTEYIRKPFSIEELIVRVENQLNLHKGYLYDNLVKEKTTLSSFSYFPLKYELHGMGKVIKLSQREKEILDVLVSRKNQVIERKKLLLDVWGDDSFFNSRNLDVYIRKLRSFFKDDINIEIKTLKGKGYLFLLNSD